MRIDINKLPVFAEFDEVPYIVYPHEKRGHVAMNDYASESGLLPEILFEGEEISRERFIELAEKRAKNPRAVATSKYKEVLDFYDSF